MEIVPPPAADADPEPQLRLAHGIRDAAALASLYPELDFPRAPEALPDDRVRRANAALLSVADGRERLDAAIQIGRALWNDRPDDLRQGIGAVGAVPGHRIDPLLEDAYTRLRAAGHYQGAMIRYGGEWYWGVDRLWHLARALGADEAGLARALPSATPGRGTAPRGQVEVFFSFRSPYSYVGLQRLAERYGADPAVTLELRPLLPMVTRGLAVPEMKKLYIARDAYREARVHGVPFGRVYDPLGEGVERCLRLFEAAPPDQRLAVSLAAFRAIWAEAEDLTDDASFARLAAEVGLDAAQVLAGGDAWRGRVEANRAELGTLGLWGVPSFRVGDGVTWGQDRLDLVHRWLCEP